MRAAKLPSLVVAMLGQRVLSVAGAGKAAGMIAVVSGTVPAAHAFIADRNVFFADKYSVTEAVADVGEAHTACAVPTTLEGPIGQTVHTGLIKARGADGNGVIREPPREMIGRRRLANW